MSETKEILVTTGYGYNTRQPFVQMDMSQYKPMIQMTPKEARDLALNLLEAAESAEQDAFFVEYIQGKIGVDLPAAAGVLVEFRDWRQARDK